MLEVKNLTKIYKLTKGDKGKDVVALDHVDIKFPDTGMVFLLGKSGSGKSTLLNTIGGLDKFDQGEIIIKGKSSKTFKQSDFDSYRNTFIGFIFQEYNILQEFSVGKNLEIAIELQGKNPKKAEVEALLEQVDLKGYYRRKPNQLSGGQKQRIAIARALIKNPEIIMADEPTGALDSNTGKQVMETLQKLSKTKLVIVVSHDREFAETYGDRIIELKDGKILSDTTKKEVEAQKTEGGLKIIDNKFIHIPKGKKLTKEDLYIIGKTIVENNQDSDTLLSIDSQANKEFKKIAQITDDGNREVFKNTSAQDIKAQNHDGNNLKLIRSRLKIKDAFKMGTSSMKHKPIRLIFTIFLTCAALIMFGVVQTLALFNRASAVNETVKTLDLKTVAITKSYSYGSLAPLSHSDLATISKENKDYIFYPSIGNNSYYSMTSSNNNNNDHMSLYNNEISGMIAFDQTIMNNLGFSLLEGKGRLPQAYNEICISKIMLEGSKQSIDNVLGTEFRLNGSEGLTGSFTIVGVIDDNYDYTPIKTKLENKDNKNYNIYSQIEALQNNSTMNMVFVTQSCFDSYAQNYAVSSQNSNLVFKNDDYNMSLYNVRKYSDVIGHESSYNLRYKNGVSSIAVNQIVVQENDFTNYFGYAEDPMAKINQGLSLELYTSYSAKKPIKTFEVVGLNSSGTILNDQDYKELFQGYDCALTSLKGGGKDSDFVNFIEKYQDKNDTDYLYSVKFESSYVLDNFGETIESVTKYLVWVALGLAVFAGLLLMNFISTSITYKKREIGILRAIGARGKDTFAIFYSESFVIGMISFVISCIGSFIVCAIINNSIINKLGIKIALLSFGIVEILLILGINLLITLIATFLPVFKIAKKNPIDSINNR